MDTQMTTNAKQMEIALRESKETTLTDQSTENSVLSTMQECQFCGKPLKCTKELDYHVHSKTTADQHCDMCMAYYRDGLSETGNKRDSGFHTLRLCHADHESVDSDSESFTINDSVPISSIMNSSTGYNISQNSFENHVNNHIGSNIHVPRQRPEDFNHDTHQSNGKIPGKKVSPKEFAENLFNCNGYKRTDVARILGKNSQYNQEIAKEYLNFFDFTDKSLISSYRQFLGQFALLGETQERERVLSFFSSRYIECNPKYLDRNPDSVHTLVCAMTLLNTDLHGNLGYSGRKKMTYKQFVANLSGLMSDGSDFPKDLLVSLYTSIKKSPLPWGGKEQRSVSRATSMRHHVDQEVARTARKPVNRSVSTHVSGKAHKAAAGSTQSGLGRSAKLKPLTENQGTLWRKTLLDSDRKKVALGKRGWRVYTITLRNLELHIAKKGSTDVRTVSIHHSMASESTSESRRTNVFKVVHADSSVALYQAGSEKEMRKWIRDINKAAAMLSAAPLCSPVGSQNVFRKALLPSAPSTLPPTNQLRKLQQLLKEHEDDLTETQKMADGAAPEISSSNQYFTDKINYLKYEVEKYKCYAQILRMHLRVNTSRYDDAPATPDNKSENGSLVSVTPSEPPLTSPSAIDTFNNLAFTDAENEPVLSSQAHFATPQHKSLALSPTSSLPNLSPIPEYGENASKVRKAGFYESSLNDSDILSGQNPNNSNAVTHTRRNYDPWIVGEGNKSSGDADFTKWCARAKIHTTVIGLTALPGDHKPFPVKRYEMRIADMDGPQDIRLARVKGRKEKKGIERYSYMQAVSPAEKAD